MFTFTGTHLHHQARYCCAQSTNRSITSLYSNESERWSRWKASQRAQQERRYYAADETGRYDNRVQGCIGDQNSGEIDSSLRILQFEPKLNEVCVSQNMKASRDRTEQFTYSGGANPRAAPPSGEPFLRFPLHTFPFPFPPSPFPLHSIPARSFPHICLRSTALSTLVPLAFPSLDSLCSLSNLT